MNEYLSAMTDILLEQGGTLDKYEGDAVVAFFGAPVPFKNHATRACLTALKMQEAAFTLWNKWQQQGPKWPLITYPFRIRIGINTGVMVTGNMGSSKRMNYTMMGDSVNLASRLESSAKQYGIYTHVSQATYELTKHEFAFRKLDTIRVVGHQEAITTYELLGAKSTLTPEKKKIQLLFESALDSYHKRDWQQAENSLKKQVCMKKKNSLTNMSKPHHRRFI